MKSLNAIFTVLLLIAPAFASAAPITIKVKGMVCGFCAQGIEKKFKALPEVSKVNVNLDSKLVSLDTVEGKSVGDEQIKQIITSAGYDVVKIER